MSHIFATFAALKTARAAALSRLSKLVCAAALFAGLSTSALAYESLGDMSRFQQFNPEAQAGQRLNAFALTKTLVAKAKSQVNSMYRFGGTTPETGFDCSGFINWVFSGVTRQPLPRQSDSLFQMAGEAVAQDDLKPGDLMFYRTMGKRVSHVTMYVGNRQFIHATRAGQRLRVESMDSAYWTRRYAGAKRILGTPLAKAGLSANDVQVPSVESASKAQSNQIFASTF
jgi:cell wall-associated NlpC family hydrolase